MNFLDFSTSNTQITDEIINVSDSNPILLKRSLFYNKTGKLMVISTAAGGGGTVLTLTTDYVPGGAFTDGLLPASIAPDVAYTTLAIVNATYHNTDLYVAYYPIGDLTTAAKLNEIDTPPSLGDFDISASNATLSMNEPNSYPVGYKFRVSWYDGDGSNTFSFTDTTGIYLNNALMSTVAWTGRGTGSLVLKKVADNYFTTNENVIFDSDSGGFSGKYFNKYTNGQMNAYQELTNLSATTSASNIFGSTSGTMYYTDNSFTFPVAFAVAPIIAPNAQTARTCEAISITTSGFNLKMWLNSSASGTLTGSYIAFGRWTTSLPRIN